MYKIYYGVSDQHIFVSGRFGTSELAKSNPQNKEFNRSLSIVRIDIEHAFGMLKDRWKSLTGLRLILTTQKKYEFACMWITAC